MKKLFCFLLLFSFNAIADLGPKCDANSAVGDTCEVKIEDLRPTQFSVGEYEVQQKQSKVAGLSDKKLQKYLKKHWAPAIVGPGGLIFITDRHHLALALLNVGVKKMLARIQGNLSSLSWDDFWDQMQAHGWVYLDDENGQGPMDPHSLPVQLNQLKDDPYRSLANAVRDQGGYGKTDTLYQDFLWANYFRSRVVISGEDIPTAVQEAMPFAHSPDAANLPGYLAGASSEALCPSQK